MVAMPTVVMKLIDCLRDTDAFAMFWQPGVIVPHDHAACSQHAPDEHILLPVTEEALAIMAGLFWDLGETPRPR